MLFWAFAGAMAWRMAIHPTIDLGVALVSGLLVYGVIRSGRSQRWLNFPWLQRLGKISYSLYLIHWPVSWIITTLGFELTGDAPLAAVGWLVLSLVASVGVAQAMHVAIESPAVRFARRFKGIGAPRPAAGPGAAVPAGLLARSAP